MILWILLSLCCVAWGNESQNLFPIFLGNLTVDLPNVTTTQYDFDVTLSNGSCYQFQLAGLRYQRLGQGEHEVYFSQVGFICSYSYSYILSTVPHFPHDYGSATVSFYDSTFYAIINNTDNQNGTVTLVPQYCYFNLSTSLIDFEGSILTKNLILSQRTNIEYAIQLSVEHKLCSSSIFINLSNISFQVPLIERKSLESLYLNTNGPNWIHKTNWMLPSDPCDTLLPWDGIGCLMSAQNIPLLSVENIALQNNNLQGELPSSLFTSYQYLIDLDLSNNALTGTLPTLSSPE
jgi:hypothetical protein